MSFTSRLEKGLDRWVVSLIWEDGTKEHLYFKTETAARYWAYWAGVTLVN